LFSSTYSSGNASSSSVYPFLAALLNFLFATVASVCESTVNPSHISGTGSSTDISPLSVSSYFSGVFLGSVFFFSS
jgi:hypothetical protein